MALKVGELYAALSLATDGFKKGLSDAEGGARKWAGKVGGVFKTAGAAIAAGLAVGVAAFTVFGGMAARNAEEQERATARVHATFGKNAEDVEWFASRMSKAFGINDDVLEVSMAKYGDWAKNVGMSVDQAQAGGEKLITRAHEIALATGKDFQEVFDGLFKGQQGMTRGLKEYGVTVDKVALATEAERMGLIKHGEALSAQDAARARGNLILQQTAQYTQIAAGMQDSMALKTAQMGASVDEIMDTVGIVFLNIATVVLPILANALSGLAAWVTDHMPEIQTVVEFVAGAMGAAFNFLSTVVVPALGAALNWIVANVVPLFAQSSAGLTTGVLPALGGAFDFITTTVIPALAAVFTWIVTNVIPPLRAIFETFTTVILPALGRAFAGVQQWIKDNWPLISKVIGQVAAAVKTAFDVIAEVIRVVAPVIVRVGEVVFPVLGTAAKVLLQVISAVFDAIGTVWKVAAEVAANVVNAIKGAWAPLTGFFTTLWNGITGIVRAGANFLIGIVNGIITAVNAIQVHIGRIGLDTPAGFIGVGPFDWNGLNLSKLGYLASGVRGWGGGWAVVGEHGPELAKLPRGTDVYNAAQSRDMMKGPGGDGGAGPITQHIYGAQPGDVERETRRALRRQALDWALEGR